MNVEQARDEMDFASESKETTYFDEEAAAAKEAVDGAFCLFSTSCASYISSVLLCRGVLIAGCVDLRRTTPMVFIAEDEKEAMWRAQCTL